MTVATDTASIIDEVVAASKAEPRCYQKRVITKGYNYFIKRGGGSVMYNSPTGSGKTCMGLFTAKMLQNLTGLGVGWCAMRSTLLNQAHEDNYDLGINVEGLTTISMFDSNPPTKDKDGRPIEILVVDECQHDAAASMVHLHANIKPRYVLGLSATPYRADKVRLCFEKVIQDAGIRQLMELGYLSKYHKFAIPQWKPECVADHYLMEPERWGQSAMYWLTEEDAVACHERLLAGGAKAGLLLGRMHKRERDDVMEKLEAGEINVVNNLILLTEGWDYPALKTAWVRDGSKGPTIQMSGRAFRKHPNHAFKQVVQSVNSRWPIERTAHPAAVFTWDEDRWLGLQATDRVEQVAVSALRAISKVQVVIPKLIMEKRRRGFRRGQPTQDMT